MDEIQIKNLINQIEHNLSLKIDERIRNHEHDGIDAKQINIHNLFDLPLRLSTQAQTIATTGNTDWVIISPISGRIEGIDFSGTDALVASDTNYITFQVVNFLRDGTGTTNQIAGGATNTTRASGLGALSADAVKELVLNTAIVTEVTEGDRIRIIASVTGTLPNTVTNSVFSVKFRKA